MTEREIRYCTTEDGVRIAYAATGEGPALVVCSGFLSQFSAEAMPGEDDFFSALGSGHRLVRYDMRGGGLSDRSVEDLSADARVRDLTAVIAALRLRRVALYSGGDLHGGAIAMTYAARHPRRVSHLILYGSFIRLPRILEERAFRTFLSMVRNNWRLAAQVMADTSTREHYGDAGLQLAKHWQASTSGEAAAALIEQSYQTDMSEVVGSLRVPTLVLHRRDDAAVPFALGRELAAKIRGARLVPLEGSVHAEMLGDSESIVRAVQEFLARPGTSTRTLPRPQTESELPLTGTAIILFADVVDSTALTERLGDAAFRARARELDTALREIIAAGGGTTIEAKTLGDGVLATFPAASQGIAAALAFERAAGAAQLQLHVGLHAGDVIREEGNVFGGAVNIAARISALSAPDEVLVSATMRELARTSAGVTFEDRGEHALKGVGDAVRVYAVRKAG